VSVLTVGQPASFVFHGGVDAALQRLKALAQVERRSTVFPLHQNLRPFQATIRGDQVRLECSHPATYGLPFPIFSGTLSHANGVTRLEGKYSAHPLSLVGLAAMLIAGLYLLFGALTALMAHGPKANAIGPVLFIFVWLGVVLLVAKLAASSADTKRLDEAIRGAFRHGA